MGAQTRVHRPGVPRPGIQRLGIPRLRVPDQGYPDQGYHDNRSRSWTKVPLVLLIWWPFLNLKPTLVHINVLTYLNTFLFFWWGGWFWSKPCTCPMWTLDQPLPKLQIIMNKFLSAFTSKTLRFSIVLNMRKDVWRTYDSTTFTLS